MSRNFLWMRAFTLFGLYHFYFMFLVSFRFLFHGCEFILQKISLKFKFNVEEFLDIKLDIISLKLNHTDSSKFVIQSAGNLYFIKQISWFILVWYLMYKTKAKIPSKLWSVTTKSNWKVVNWLDWIAFKTKIGQEKKLQIWRVFEAEVLIEHLICQEIGCTK